MDLDKSVILAVKNFTHQLHRYMTAKKEDIIAKVKEFATVTEIQGRIINYLYESKGPEPIYQKDLEKQFNIRRSTATIILKRMEKSGLVVRRISRTDARMKELILTEKAKILHPVAKAEFLKAEKNAVKGLTEKEIESFLQIVEKITRNIS